VRVDGWSLSFYEILQQMLGPHNHHAVVINPVAGPETIAGSSREYNLTESGIAMYACAPVSATAAGCCPWVTVAVACV
jgi:hypothetical protein